MKSATPDPNRGSPLVGRERELGVLLESWSATLDGQGRLALISGGAGVGKTSLAEALCKTVAHQGPRVLTGRCYDQSETPPYGPWTEIRAGFLNEKDIPPLPNALYTNAQSSHQFFIEVRDFFTAATEKQPLIVLLEDVQWADAASLDLLRFLARSPISLRTLLIVTYRPDELDRHHPLNQVLPLLVRESRPIRLDLGPLSVDALRDLVNIRYNLTDPDERRLVAYLARRTDGNALFASEVLRTLEELGMVSDGNLTPSDLDAAPVPVLLRQVVQGRAAYLGVEAERLLDLAAVIGEEVPLDVLAEIAETDLATVESVVEQALSAGLFVERHEAGKVVFAHTLIREALYEDLRPFRRRRLHQRVGELLASTRGSAADAVAYHFHQAGDPRASEWLVRAGWRAYRSFAYHTARARFSAALPSLVGAERARTLLALATLDRYRERGVAYAENAVLAASSVNDASLSALAQFRLGVNLGYQNRVREALGELDAAELILDALADDELPDLYSPPGLRLSRADRRAHRAWLLAYSGRWRDALELLGGDLDAVLERLDDQDHTTRVALWFICGWLGRPGDLRRIIDSSIAAYTALDDDLAVLAVRIGESYSLQLPFFADSPEERQRYQDSLEDATQRVERSLGNVPALLNRCPLLVLSGRWTEASELWARRQQALASGGDAVGNVPYIGMVARAQGDRDAAWALIRQVLPDGPSSSPGSGYFDATVKLQCLAARLAMDDGRLELARQWLKSHQIWMTWAGSEVRWSRPDGQLAWAEYFHCLGQRDESLRRAEQAITESTEPRQPLALLAGHLHLGTLHTEERLFLEARRHLELARHIADAAATQYEGALTRLALAKLSSAQQDIVQARSLLAELRPILESLGAWPALADADAIAVQLDATPRSPEPHPAGLSARELDVLRLVVQGWTDRQIAERLFLSPRTVNHHLRSIYSKLGVSTRTAATGFAIKNDLV